MPIEKMQSQPTVRIDLGASVLSRTDFCRELVSARERKNISIEEIVQLTKIPKKSLGLLEAGRFEELPADIFVRGFLRAYGEVVGLEPGRLTVEYARCRSADVVTSGDRQSRETQPMDVSEVLSTDYVRAPAITNRPPRSDTTNSPQHTVKVDTRAPTLTFAVIILVIVATLTMSYLLREPDRVGDGVTMISPTTAPLFPTSASRCVNNSSCS